jgi:hypothetical protein
MDTGKCGHDYAGDLNNHEDYDQENEHLLGLLVHGM